MPTCKDPIKEGARRQKIRLAHTGERNHNYGKTIPLAQRERIAQSLRGRKLPKELCERLSQIRLGHPTSDETKQKIRETKIGEKNPNFGKHPSNDTREKLREARRGEKHPNWKGGITPIRKTIRRLLECNTWRLAVFERDLYTCRECGQHGVYLHAHHIIPFSKIIERNHITT